MPDDVIIEHEVKSGRPAPSGVPGKIDGYLYDQPLILGGGSTGQSIVRDSTADKGGVWDWMVPAVPVTSYDDIPDGQVRFYFGGTPTKLALVYNNGGTFVEMSVTP